MREVLLSVDVQAASIQDRDGAEALLRQARKRFPFIERIIGDGGDQRPKRASLVARTGAWRLEIVKRSELHRFVVLPKRWIVDGRWPGSAATGACRAITNATPAKAQPRLILIHLETEGLRKHSVPLDKRAIAELKSNSLGPTSILCSLTVFRA